MLLVDTELEKRHREGNPIQVGLVGAGYMGRGITIEMLTGIAGIRLAAISNRSMDEAVRAFHDAGVDSIKTIEGVKALEVAVDRNEYAITSDPDLICQCENLDAVIEATGDVEFASYVALAAIENGKHVILMDAELDATVGPILKVYADRAGVIITNTDGDEPGVAMNLYRFVKGIGYHPVLAGNIKGFIDHYRNPETQREFAARVGQKPQMVSSFADGTKLAMETTVLANATGFKVGKRGMYGPQCSHVKEILNYFSPEQFLEHGLVDYVLGAEPGTGAFVVGYNDHPDLMQYMRYFKMGDGPLYVFYTPYHLPHLQIASTLARAVLFQDATIAPKGAPSCEVITVAKQDLFQGDVLDGIGGFTCYGLTENAEICRTDHLLPMGVSQGCCLTHDIQKDQVITYEDVTLPKGRLVDRLRIEQDEYFAG